MDLLNKLFQASDQWDKALATAEESDRIHLRGTYHNYAGVLEQRGDTSGAAHMYHRADTHRHQVPRMLQQDPAALQQYTLKSKDPWVLLFLFTLNLKLYLCQMTVFLIFL